MKTTPLGSRGAVRRLALALVLLLAGALCSVPQARAQRGPGGGMDREQYLDRMMTALADQVGVTDVQAEKIRPLFAAHFDQMQEVRRQHQGQGRRAMREQMTEYRKTLDRSVEALLTPQQVEKYRALRDSQPWGGGQGRRGGRRGN